MATPRAVLNHLMMYVDDVERSVRFYSTVLGVVAPSDIDPGYAHLELAGGMTLAFHLRRPEDSARASDSGVYLYLETHDLESACEALRAHGVELTQPPERM